MLAKLIAIQKRDSLTDGQMAARLGVSRSSWNLYRRSVSPFPHDVAVVAAGVWPELTRDLIDLAESAAGSLTDDRPSVDAA